MTDGKAVVGVPSDSDIDAIVDALRVVDRKSAWDCTLSVGRIVFENIVGGDEREWRSRRSQKNVSLRKLVQHPRCPFKKSALCAAVNTYLFVKTNPFVVRLPGISPTHLGQVLGLPQLQALEILNAGAAGSWTVREISEEVRALRRQAGERRGRPVSPADRKAETLARRAAVALQRMHGYLRDCSSVQADAARTLDRVFDEISTVVDEARELLGIARRSSVARSPVKVRDSADVELATA